MKYLLDKERTFSKSFIFWVTKFIVNKALTTSQRTVKNREEFNLTIVRIENSKIIDEIEYYLRKIRSCGYGGLSFYHQPIIKLYHYLSKQKLESMREINIELLIKYLTLTTGSHSNATKGNWRRAITNFFNFIDKNNYNKNRSSHIYGIDLRNWEKNSIIPKARVPIFLEENEIRSFLIALDEYKKESISYYRNSFMLKLVLFTGLRSTELLDIKYEDITEKGNLYKISIIGKGNKYREVFINKEYMEDFFDQNYLNKKTKDLVFKSKKNDKLTQAYISRAVDRVLIMANIKKAKKGTHLLRHTFATQLYRKTKDVFLIKEALGHADINTSMIYTHLDDNELEKTTNIMDDLF